MSYTADLFCKVVDNFGDAGIAWRLATGLATREFAVRLFTDNPDTLAKITHNNIPSSVTIIPWNGPIADDITPADLVIDVLSGHAPDAYKERMAAHSPKPVWMYYEYLSAEKWVEDVHLTSSPHPRLPLVQHFFYPGFSDKTGGLLWPNALINTDSRFCENDNVNEDKYHPNISIFTYRNNYLKDILNSFYEQKTPVNVDIPNGLAVPDVCAFLGVQIPAALPATFTRGELTINIIPFMPQADYFGFLRTHTLNFVRGEDSLTSAVLSGRPFIWHIYPQDEDTHLEKLEAFLDMYTSGMPPAPACAYRDFTLAWNHGAQYPPSWESLALHLPALAIHARNFAEKVRKNGNAVQNLVDFYQKLR